MRENDELKERQRERHQITKCTIQTILPPSKVEILGSNSSNPEKCLGQQHRLCRLCQALGKHFLFNNFSFFLKILQMNLKLVILRCCICLYVLYMQVSWSWYLLLGFADVQGNYLGKQCYSFLNHFIFFISSNFINMVQFQHHTCTPLTFQKKL